MSVYLLDSNELIVYNKISEAISMHKESVAIPNISNDKVIDLYNKAISENIEGYLYNIGSVKRIRTVLGSTLKLNLIHYDGRTIKLIQDKTEGIVNNVRNIGDEYEKVLDVYKYFVKSFDYAKNDLFVQHQVASPLIRKTAVCEGFAFLFSRIMNYLGFTCGIVMGTSCMNGKMEPHAWNVIKMGNNYYHIDVTWDICTKEKGLDFFDYFMLSDEKINIDHQWLDYSIPRCTDFSQEYYIKHNLFCNSIYEVKMLMISSIKKRKRYIGFRINNSIKISVNDNFIKMLIKEAFDSVNLSYSEISYTYNSFAKTFFLAIMY